MNVKRFIITLILILAIFFCIIAGIFAAQFFSLTDSITGDPSSEVDQVTSGRTNILIMGLDKDGTRSDVMMLASLNTSTNSLDIISIPRDTKVNYKGHNIKINATMGYEAKQDATIRVVKELTGLPVHYYAIANFEGFRNIIDILGGVEYDVKRDYDYDDPAQDLHIHIKKGFQVLNGKDSEGLVRYRHDYVMGDYDRINVQQDFMKELLKQKLNAKYFFEFPKIAGEISKHVKTNMSVMDAAKYLGFLKGLTSEKMTMMTLPGDSSYIDGVSYFVADDDAIDEMVERMNQGLPATSIPAPSPTSSPSN